ncbi:hypothetical protein Tco_0540972 [Tanacetum coccineum]
MGSNEETNAAGTDTRPPMLVESDYDSWKIRIHRYIRGKPNGKLIWNSIQNGPTPHPMVTDPPPTGSTIVPAPRKKLDSEFNDEENKLEMADTQAEIILSQGLPRHIFNILNQTSTAQEIWNNVELLMQGSGRTLQQRKEDLFDEYERFRAIGNESIHDYFVRFHKLVNDMKITQLEIPTHQMNTKFVNNLPAYWGKYVTNVKQNMDISTTPYVQIYTHLKAYEPHAKKTLKKQEQSTSIVDPLAYVAHTTSAPALSSPSTPSPQPTAQSPNDALMATMTQIANLLSGFQKQFPPTNNQLRTSSNSRTHATVHDGHIVTEPVQRKALANHRKAYDSDVDEGPNAAVAFMANLSSTSATNSQVNEVHSNNNAICDNVHDQLSQEMHQDEHLDSDAETEIDDNTIPYHQYLLDTEAQNVPTWRGIPKRSNISRNKVRQNNSPSVFSVNKRNAELVQENDLLKSTLSGKEKSIAFLQSEKEKILSEKKDLADSYLDEIVCLKNANKVARDMLQRFNMPTQTIPMLSKKPKAATGTLHKDLLGTRNPGLGYIAKRAQPVLYDADTLLHPAHHPVRIWDSEDVLVHQVVSMKKMSEKPGHVRPANGFYDKLNAMMFVPQKELSQEQAYWLICQRNAIIDTSSDSNAIFKINKLRQQLQGKDDTIRNLDAQINIMKVLNVGSTASSCDQQVQLKDTITSLRIQLDGLKLKSAINCWKNALKAPKKLVKQVEGPSTSEYTPKCLPPGMYNLGSKYIPPPKRANWVKPTPLPKKRQVTFSEPPRPSLKPTQKPVVHPNKQTNVCVPMSTGVKPTSGASKTVVQIVLWYLDSGCSRHMTGDRARLINFVEKFIGDSE